MIIDLTPAVSICSPRKCAYLMTPKHASLRGKHMKRQLNLQMPSCHLGRT